MKEMLTQLMDSVGAYLPTLLGALLILIVGWIVAAIASRIALRSCVATSFVSILSEKAITPIEQSFKFVFWTNPSAASLAAFKGVPAIEPDRSKAR